MSEGLQQEPDGRVDNDLMDDSVTMSDEEDSKPIDNRTNTSSESAGGYCNHQATNNLADSDMWASGAQQQCDGPCRQLISAVESHRGAKCAHMFCNRCMQNAVSIDPDPNNKIACPTVICFEKAFQDYVSSTETSVELEPCAAIATEMLGLKLHFFEMEDDFLDGAKGHFSEKYIEMSSDSTLEDLKTALLKLFHCSVTNGGLYCSPGGSFEPPDLELFDLKVKGEWMLVEVGIAKEAHIAYDVSGQLALRLFCGQHCPV